MRCNLVFVHPVFNFCGLHRLVLVLQELQELQKLDANKFAADALSQIFLGTVVATRLLRPVLPQSYLGEHKVLRGV